jgi:chromate transporter
VKIGKRALKRQVHYLIAGSAFFAIYVLAVPFPFIVVAAGIIGLLGTRFLPGSFTPNAEKHKQTQDAHGNDLLPLAIPDLGELPPHTRPSKIRVLRVFSVGLILWLLPFVALIAWQGSSSLHVQEYRFFTQAALVTFGGAYAVLAYVTQAVTNAPYNWLTPPQAVDGLALAETTPGPLIMVLQFVGFMAGWNNPVAGLDQATSAVLGGLVTTYVTFLPSFLFIFLGAPYIEYLRGNRLLTGVLTGITSAVVGVILNLAFVFGMAVIAPNGWGGSVNWFLAVLSVLAFVALYRIKVDVVWVVLAGGIVGLIRASITS